MQHLPETASSAAVKVRLAFIPRCENKKGLENIPDRLAIEFRVNRDAATGDAPFPPAESPSGNVPSRETKNQTQKAGLNIPRRNDKQTRTRGSVSKGFLVYAEHAHQRGGGPTSPRIGTGQQQTGRTAASKPKKETLPVPPSSL